MIARIRPYVECAPIPGGVHVRAAQRSFTLRGKGVASVVRRFLALLDGQRSLEQIREEAPRPVGPLLDTLLDQLRLHDMLAPAAPASVGPAPDAAGPLRPTLAFFEDQGVSSLAFDEARATAIKLHGDGPILREAIRLLERSGMDNLQVQAAGSDWREPADKARGQELIVLADRLPPDLPMATGAAQATLLISFRQGPVGMVATLSPQHGHLLPTLKHRMPDRGIDGAPVSDSRLGALLAQETLRSVAAMHRTDSPARPSCRMLHVLSDWDVREEDLTPFSPAQIQDHGGARQFHARAQAEMLHDWLAALQTEFDAVLGRFRWDEEGPESIFPLPHAAVVLDGRMAGEPVRERFVAWGLTPVESKYRALSRAVTALVRREGGGDRRISVARDVETWRAGALARALFASGDLRRYVREVVPVLDGAGEADLVMMKRLAGLYRPEPLALRLFQVGGLAAFSATAVLGSVAAEAIAPTPAAAMVDASGKLLSRLQQEPALAVAEHEAPSPTPAGASASFGGDPGGADLQAYGYKAEEVILPDASRRPGAFVAGFVELRSRHG
jgi:hypothetical protein